MPTASNSSETLSRRSTKPRKRKSRPIFALDDFVVYPTHGVGRIVALENMEIEGQPLELFVISFEQEKMLLRVPVHKAEASGMRSLAKADIAAAAADILAQKARGRKTMWSRRAHEYEAKINSGDLVAVAEVVRDLFRPESKSDQSYSERQLYESALSRYVREIAVIERKNENEIIRRVESCMTRAFSLNTRCVVALDGNKEKEKIDDPSSEDSEKAA